VENPPYPPNFNTDSQLDCARDASNWHNPPSLLPVTDGDNPSSKGSSDRSTNSEPSSESNSSHLSPSDDATSESPQDVRYIQQVLLDIRAQQEARQEAFRMANEQRQRIKQEAVEARIVARMRQFLHSGDPILVAEALAWAQVNPGVLEVNQLSLPIDSLTNSPERYPQ
jgi:hypothetical protein